MAHASFKALRFKLDNAAGALTTVSASLNAIGLEGVLSLLEDTSMADGERQYLPGLAGATIPISGFWNTSTEGLFGPLLGNDTSITKTVEYRSLPGSAARYYNGEASIRNLRLSGSVDTVETFSADLVFDGTVNRTSVALP